MESQIVLIILLIMVVTYVPRTAPLLFLTRFNLPNGVILWLKYIPVAVLSALLYPSILLPAGELEVSLGNEFLVAALPTLLVVWYTRSLFWTVVVGSAGGVCAQGDEGVVPYPGTEKDCLLFISGAVKDLDVISKNCPVNWNIMLS